MGMIGRKILLTKMCTNANKGYEQFIPKIDISGSLKTKSKWLTREMMKKPAKKIKSMLYVSLVRPHLEFAVPVWNPYLKKDTEKLENVQHKATKLVAKLRNEGYEDRLKMLRLTTLETRRINSNKLTSSRR